ncbi:MAG: tRNA-specific adenosine deaminase [Acidobacteria bacterium]|nr:MAG: tRNA-specific adenosine deaminase [Acidobacteriota bacterium]
MQEICQRELTSAEYDEIFMRVALTAAYRGTEFGEVPIGACIVDENGQVIGATSNRTITDNDPTGHAEIRVLRRAAELRKNYRLTGMTVYSTIEPCVMCAGALVNARIKRLVFGAHDERFGAVETLFRLCDNEALNHRIEITSGLLADECRTLMQKFFRERR